MQTPQALSTSFIDHILHARRRVKSWQESAYDELANGPTLVRANVINLLEGDVEGESWEEYLLMYRPDGSCSFVSMERVVGCIGDRSGSFVLQSVGSYKQGIATGQLTIMPGSATRGLVGLQGEGQFVTLAGSHSTLTLTCAIHI
ncbi:DUF3224 domain-containing protein [Spirosoma soli]|uniref:DUF3224 domain-containing protein n=1 Tax=Spirosoma soli TaxID=1770529 RepID=A0ABW5M042_9BACT